MSRRRAARALVGLATAGLAGLAWLEEDARAPQRAPLAPAASGSPVAAAPLASAGGSAHASATAAAGRAILGPDAPAADAAALEGTVLDPDGGGVPGALLALLADEPGASDGAALASARSDARGRFALPLAGAEDGAWIACDAAGYVPEAWPLAPGEPAWLRPRPAVALRGRVLDALGAPLAGALVLCDLPHAEASGWSARTRVTTDAAGAFALERVPRDEALTLQVLLADGQRACATLARPEEGAELALRLPRAHELAILLQDEASGAPLRERRVVLHGAVALATDARGVLCWRRGADEAGTIDLAVEGLGTLTLSEHRPGTPDAPALVPVPAALCALRGVVRDAAGAPLAGARVQARVLWTSADAGAAQVHCAGATAGGSDAQGAFALSLPAGAAGRVRLAVERAGFLPAVWEDDARALCERTLAIELRPAARIAGRVRAAAGMPPPAAVAWEGAESAGRAWLDREGRFAIEGLAPGLVRLLAVWGPMRDPGAEELARVTLAAGEERALELAPAAPRTVVSGLVLEADGTPVPGARVEGWAHDESRDLGSTAVRSDAGGRFALSLPADPALALDLEARAGERVARRTGVPAGARELALVLEPWGRVALLVRDADTLAPLADVALAWRGADDAAFAPLHGDARRRFGGADGRVDERVPGTRGTLRVEARGYAPAELALALGSDPAPLEVRLAGGEPLRLHFVLGDPRSPERLPASVLAGGVRLVRADGPADARTVRAGPSGEAELAGLAPGTWILESSLARWGFDPERIVVRPGMGGEAFVAIVHSGDERSP